MSSFHIVELHVKPEEKENLLESFKMLHEQTGFIGHTIYQSGTDEYHLVTVEEWESLRDHENFMATLPEGAFYKWAKMLSEPPKGSFFTKLN